MQQSNSKIKIDNLYLIFGEEPAKILQALEEGQDKAGILNSTGGTVAVNNATFEVYEGEVFVVMGLSGSGKSTLLRCINRLIEATKGDIYIDQENVMQLNQEDLRQLRRTKISMVFQHFGLLPHRSVQTNVEFGLEIAGINKKERAQKAKEAIQMVGLEGYEKQKIKELSGGMQQRVGLARALANNPEILLMDEAFSALDPLIRTQMQEELLKIQERMHKTILFITHDLDEALTIGDRIAIMNEGRIEQIGTAENILLEPVNDYVADFVHNVDRSKVLTPNSLLKGKTLRKACIKESPGDIHQQMKAQGLKVIAITNEDEYFLGFIKLSDLENLLKEKQETSVEAILLKDAPAVTGDKPLFDVMAIWDSDLPVAVVDENNYLKGVLARKAVIHEISDHEIDYYKI